MFESVVILDRILVACQTFRVPVQHYNAFDAATGNMIIDY